MSNVEYTRRSGIDGGSPNPKPAVEEIKVWMIGYVSRLLDLEPGSVSSSQTFDEIGLDSMMVVVMTEELALWLGREIDPTVAYDHPTIEKFAAYLSVQ